MRFSNIIPTPKEMSIQRETITLILVKQDFR